MNNLNDILSEVQKLGVRLLIIDGKLKALPRGRLSSELKTVLREHAAEIKMRLAAPPTPAERDDQQIVQRKLDAALVNQARAHVWLPDQIEALAAFLGPGDEVADIDRDGALIRRQARPELIRFWRMQ